MQVALPIAYISTVNLKQNLTLRKKKKKLNFPNLFHHFFYYLLIVERYRRSEQQGISLPYHWTVIRKRGMVEPLFRFLQSLLTESNHHLLITNQL